MQASNQQYSLDKLLVNNGSIGGAVNVIFQDTEGFVWLGSEKGVHIYDGYKLTPLLGPDNDFNLFSSQLIKQDSQGLMWLNLQGKGLYTLNSQTRDYEKIAVEDTHQQALNVVDVVETRPNIYWIATAKTLGVYDNSTKLYQQKIDLTEQLTALDNIQNIFIVDDLVYIATRAGVYVYHIGLAQWRMLPDLSHTNAAPEDYEPINANKIFQLFVSQQGLLYLGTNDGVFTLETENIIGYIQEKLTLPHYELLIKHLSIWQFLVEKNNLYISSDAGLSVVQLDSNQGRFLFGLSQASEHINDNQIISLMIDDKGIFWLGSASVGIYTWNSKRELVKNFRYRRNGADSLSDNYVTDVHQQDQDANILWVSTGNGLNRLNLENDTVQQFIVTPPESNSRTFNQSHIVSLSEDDQHRLWLSTSLGMKLFDINKQSLIALPFSEEVNSRLQTNVLMSYLDDAQTLWYVDEDKVINVSLTTGKLDELTELNAAVSPRQVWKIMPDFADQQHLLLSTNNALWRYDINERQMELLYQHPKVQEADWSHIESWVIDNDVIWLAFSGEGLIGLSKDTFDAKYFYHKGNSIIDNNVYGVMKDQSGGIWFSTHQGLYTLDSVTHHIRQFSLKDGFVAMEYNWGAYTQLADQRFAYGSMEGVSLFFPERLKRADSEHEFSVHITEVDVLSRKLTLPIVFSDNMLIPLNYDDVGIRVGFSTFSYGNNDNILFDYRLVGQNNIHYPPTNESHITFPNLASGSHVLEVRAKSPNTGEYSAPIRLNFSVTYAPWHSPFAYFLYGLIVLIFLGIFSRRRHAQRRLLLDIHEQVKSRENRLQLALTGSNSEVWDWQIEDNLMFGKRIALELGYKNEALFYSFAEHVNLIHLDDRENFVTTWKLFIANANLEDNFSCTYRLKSIDDKWLWYKDLGKIVAVNLAGEPTRITGSYTNITQSLANEERAQYYGDVFKQTKDWVLIIDEKIQRVTANQSMREVFQWTDEEFDFQTDILGITPTRQDFYTDLLLSLKEGEHWCGEELVTTVNKQEYHVIVNISVGKNSITNTLHYILVLTDISAQKSAEKELRFLANYDHLTGLPNRSLLLERINHAIDFSNRNDTNLALFFIDLDRFKQINDSLGHDYGDLLLKEVTKRLTDVLRADDTVARIGGDEFVVLLESFTNTNQLGGVAQKVIDAIGKSIQLNNNVVGVGASIGIAIFPEDAQNSDELLRNADVAMYHAKQLGRNNFQFFTDQMNFDAKQRLDRESSLKQAVQKGEFINHYQPILEAVSGKTVGFELLMRWKTSEGLVVPSEFIALSEELGLIVTMTEVALERGLIALKQWHIVYPNLYLSVNLSSQHFANENLVTYIKNLLERHGLASHFLRIEVTECALMSEPEKAINTMCALSSLGVTLALDDFGTGFSSLAYLKKLPLDFMKIDRSFVLGIGKNQADEAIVDTTLVLAKRLNMRCIAEGVETEGQLAYLIGKECDFVQGYFYGKPLSASDVMKQLMANQLKTGLASP